MKLPPLYHGTSKAVLQAIETGQPFVKPVFAESNVSLGGAYFTSTRYMAEAHACLAAGMHSSDPVILMVDPTFDLLPDEDFVVHVAEKLDESEIKKAGLTKFMADLFIGYPGDGHSLSDHYKARYDDLNARHGITWKHSLKWINSVRQADGVTADQILEVIPVAAKVV